MITQILETVIFLIILTLTYCDTYNFDVEENFYQTYSEAIEKGAVKRGWIPAFFPPDATKIFERHNIDSNEITIKFNYSPSSLSSIYNACKKIKKSQVRYPRRSAKWWPNTLKPYSGFLQSSYEFFSCNVEFEYEGLLYQKQMAFLALDNNNLTAWFWQF
ncbi:MAG: hypothetical protein L3V56_05340 [Candidatus Magnetoovum sp. WYHC-5]|nr:hypothetical protein [Candidatus Magnetoovum sp. WYHC-5]